jgi:hypothetical protein
MRAASIAIAAAITAFAGISATAGEQLVRLRQAPGLDKVEANCTACHSLDYVQMNSPFLSAAGWEAEVAKMINAFGALMDQSDAKIIIDYLNNNYGKESSISEKEKSDMSSANVGMTLANYDTKGSEAGRVTMIPRSIHHASFKRHSFQKQRASCLICVPWFRPVKTSLHVSVRHSALDYVR